MFGRKVRLDDLEVYFRKHDRIAAAVENNGLVAIFLVGQHEPPWRLVQLAGELRIPPQLLRLYPIQALPRSPNGKISYVALRSLVH